MSYENAPATKMLATCCVCCHSPLVDSVSVECGVGPDCRVKYGFTSPQKPPDWVLVAKFNPLDNDAGKDSRTLCNRLVYRLARGVESREMIRIVSTIQALGFHLLANKIASRFVVATITVEGGMVGVKTTKYNEKWVEESRKIPGRRYLNVPKKTVFPERNRVQIWNVLKKVFRGNVIQTPKGLIEV